MEVSETKLKGVLLINLHAFEDHRGEYLETYNEERYRENGIDIKFVQDDISISTLNVLRGIHSDAETWKLISCLWGRLYLVVVNCNADSSDFGKWQHFTLSDTNRQQVLAPPKHGVAHLVLSDKAIFHYKQSTYYDPSRQSSYKWNDLGFNIWWPTRNPVLSQRDEEGQYIAE